MAIAAFLVATVLGSAPVLAPQDPPKTILGKSDLQSLNKKAQKWFGEYLKYENADSSKERSKTGKSMRKAREAFEKDFEAKKKKGNLLASVPDLRAIFTDAFPYPRNRGTGEVKPIREKDGVPGYSIVVPKVYRSTSGTQTVVVIPGFDDSRDGWTPAKDYYEAAWRGTTTAAESIFLLLQPDDGLALDPMARTNDPVGERTVIERLQAVFLPARAVQQSYNIDRDKLFLDCGRESGLFGLRLVTYFPARFAGIVVRSPRALGELRVGSLAGFPVCLVWDQDTKAVAEEIAKQLNDLAPDSATLIEGKGGYPYGESKDAIGEWMAKTQRQLNRHHVIIEPNNDRFKKAYWVSIGTSEALAEVAKDDRPRLEAKVDRDSNRIEISTTGVNDFALYLNDALVNLDEEITLVVNGTAIKERRTRQFAFMKDLLQTRFDPTYVFTAEYKMVVPKSSDGEDGSGADK